MQWAQDISQIHVNYLNNVKREDSKHFSNKEISESYNRGT
jgi:hypothetical protein